MHNLGLSLIRVAGVINSLTTQLYYQCIKQDNQGELLKS